MEALVNAMYPNRYFLTVKEVCALTTYSPSTLRRTELKGEFPPREKISTRKVGFRKDLVIQFLKGEWKNGNAK
tara:strand:- start:1396 stop:1614 length:219 start_codon:yes stop_codon:yes gene_type:complete